MSKQKRQKQGEQRTPTTERLAAVLQEANAPRLMIERAKAGYYDDFKSDLEQPIVALVADCNKYGLFDIANRAIDGEFDAPQWESEEWARSPEGREMLKSFGLEL